MNYFTKRTSYLYTFDRSNHAILPTRSVFEKREPLWLSRHKLSGFDNVIGKIDREHYVMCVVYFDGIKMKDTQLGITGTVMKKYISENLIESSNDLSNDLSSDLSNDFPNNLSSDLSSNLSSDLSNDLPITLHENIEFGAIREGAEELGLFFDKTSLENKTYARHPTKKIGQYQDVYTYTINISNCVPYFPDEHLNKPELASTKETGWEDDRSKKVQVIVHGSLEKLSEIIEQITNRIPSNELESIKGIRLLHQQDVYLGMKWLNRRKK